LQSPFPGHAEQLVPVTILSPKAKAITAISNNSKYLINFLKKSGLVIDLNFKLFK